MTGVRHWSTPDYTRVAIDVEQEVKFGSQRISNPDRIFFDLRDTKLASTLVGKTFDVDDGFLKKIRVAEFQPGRTRIVLEVDNLASYDAFLLPDPYRLIIDIHGKDVKGKEKRMTADAARNAVHSAPEMDAASSDADDDSSVVECRWPCRRKDGRDARFTPRKRTPARNLVRKRPGKMRADNGVTLRRPTVVGKEWSEDLHCGKTTAPDPEDNCCSGRGLRGRMPKTMRKTRLRTARRTPRRRRGLAARAFIFIFIFIFADPRRAARSRDRPPWHPLLTLPIFIRMRASKLAKRPAKRAPTAAGDRSLTRALGLKIGKIVIDAGHGGHDTGTIGPNGLQEKDVVLDVAKRLGRLLESRLGAEVIYTRQDDTFIPLETRTAIANRERADLFISIHANSSHDTDARGVETYYLNFTSSPEALEVAARENAVSEKSIYELQDLVKKIALKEKIEESREFAGDVQQSLYGGLALNNAGIRNRGIKKAPFIVLIGANMPSILAEISFVSNPTDERKLETSEHRQRIAESLYRGVSKYVNGLSGVKVASKIDKPEGQ